ncbi:MAG: amidohydrolase, partial [Armatimonadetes bacterium]|nr:amidohydrolase [Armatimonadota bacterium]
MDRTFEQKITTILPSIVKLRHDLHAHPELGFQEHRTGGIVAQMLESYGMEVRRVAKTGVVADLKGAQDGPIFALRADMDALPIHELNDLPYKSQTPGLMHACGHDGHTSVLVGTARVLSELKDGLKGTIRFIFQPSEENVQGARAMIEEGVMNGVEGIIALHDWNDTEPGNISIKSGPILASADTFILTITGQGGHAAYPHLAVDPIMVGAQLVASLQTLVSREVTPLEPVVVTVGAFNAGHTDNVIPNQAVLKGTVRTLNPEVREAMPERLERIIAGVCAAFRAEYALEYTLGCGVTMNEREMAKLIAETAADLLGPDHVRWYFEPSMGGEDFSEYLRYAPGAMFL